MTRLGLLVLCGAFLFSPGASLAQGEDPSLEALVVEMASSAEQHAALARHYRAKAEESRQEMRRHDRMGGAYSGGKLTQRQRMMRHCKNLSEKYASMAEDYDALAELHEEAAKQGQ